MFMVGRDLYKFYMINLVEVLRIFVLRGNFNIYLCNV